MLSSGFGKGMQSIWVLLQQMEYEKLPVRVLWHRNGIPYILQYPIHQNSVTGLSLTAGGLRNAVLSCFQK